MDPIVGGLERRGDLQSAKPVPQPQSENVQAPLSDRPRRSQSPSTPPSPAGTAQTEPEIQKVRPTESVQTSAPSGTLENTDPPPPVTHTRKQKQSSHPDRNFQVEVMPNDPQKRAPVNEPGRDEDDIVEESPHGRFVRFREVLGRGAFKTVFKAYDTREGCEVAWNAVKLAGIPEDEKKRIVQEIKLLYTLKHPHILKFHQTWIKSETEIVFVTEILGAGSLKSFIKKVKVIRWKVVKRWCHDILSGLTYLHNQEPSVIHRDLKCDNIFINGQKGDLRIGDLGLSRRKDVAEKGKAVLTLAGTPAFMAPEFYTEQYDEKVDIYALGMCVLEMLTKEYPYHECASPAMIMRAVTEGTMPRSLERITLPQARDFIENCLQRDPTLRPSAEELAKHDFLRQGPEDDVEVKLAAPLPPLGSGCAGGDRHQVPAGGAALAATPLRNSRSETPPAPAPATAPSSTPVQQPHAQQHLQQQQPQQEPDSVGAHAELKPSSDAPAPVATAATTEPARPQHQEQQQKQQGFQDQLQRSRGGSNPPMPKVESQSEAARELRPSAGQRGHDSAQAQQLPQQHGAQQHAGAQPSPSSLAPHSRAAPLQHSAAPTGQEEAKEEGSWDRPVTASQPQPPRSINEVPAASTPLGSAPLSTSSTASGSSGNNDNDSVSSSNSAEYSEHGFPINSGDGAQLTPPSPSNASTAQPPPPQAPFSNGTESHQRAQPHSDELGPMPSRHGASADASSPSSSSSLPQNTSGIHYDYSPRLDDGGHAINVELEIPIRGEFEIVSFPFDVSSEDPHETAMELCSAYEVGTEQVPAIESILMEILQDVGLHTSNKQSGQNSVQQSHETQKNQPGSIVEEQLTGYAGTPVGVETRAASAVSTSGARGGTFSEQAQGAPEPTGGTSLLPPAAREELSAAEVPASEGAAVEAQAVAEAEFFASLGAEEREALELEVGGGVKFEEGRLRRLEESIKSKEEIEKARIKKYNDDHMEMSKKIEREKLLIAGKRRKIVEEWKVRREAALAKTNTQTTSASGIEPAPQPGRVEGGDAAAQGSGIEARGTSGTVLETGAAPDHGAPPPPPTSGLSPSSSPPQPPQHQQPSQPHRPMQQQQTQRLAQPQNQQQQSSLQQQHQQQQQKPNQITPQQQQQSVALKQQQQIAQQQIAQQQQQQVAQQHQRAPQAPRTSAPQHGQLQPSDAQHTRPAVSGAERHTSLPPAPTHTGNSSNQLPSGSSTSINTAFYTPSEMSAPIGSAASMTQAGIPSVFDPFSDLTTPPQQQPQQQQQQQQHHQQQQQWAHSQQPPSAPTQQQQSQQNVQQRIPQPPQQQQSLHQQGSMANPLQQQQRSGQVHDDRFKPALKTPSFPEEINGSMDHPPPQTPLMIGQPRPHSGTVSSGQPRSSSPSAPPGNGATTSAHLAPNSDPYRQQQQRPAREKFAPQQSETAQPPARIL